MAKSLLLFDFEHINEDQLKDVIERVKRDRRRRRENAAWLAYSSRRKEENLSKTDLSTSNLTEREHRVHKIFYQSSLEDDTMEKYESMQESVDYLQILGQKEDNNALLKEDKPEFRHILQKICFIRRNISEILDSILAQSELKFLSEYVVRGAPTKFEESENMRRIMNYRYRILGLDYQMVMNMRTLTKNITINDVFLGNLSKCHSTASKLLQVFVLGWCDLMKMNQIREKFCDLMKSVITLSRVCQTICGGLNDLDDFLIDVLSKKCNIILHTVDKEFSKKIQKKYSANVEEELKEERKECLNKKKLSNESINLKSKDDLVSIPVKTFKKLAKKHFNGLETRIKEEKNVKILTHDKNSRKQIRPHTKMSQGKKVNHSSNVIHIKSSVNTSIEGEGDRPDLSSKKQNNSHFETELKNFDIESFSKKLYSTLEKEICTNLKCIFNNLSFGQLQIFQAAGQNNGRHVFYQDDHLELLEKLKKSLHIPVLEETPLEIECGNLHGEKEVTESNIDSPKQNEDSSSLKIKEDGYVALQRCLSDHQTRPKPPLQEIESSHNSKNSSLEQHITRKEEPSSSGNRKLVGDDRKELLGATVRSRTVHSAQGMEPWDAIDCISEKLIAECLKSISSELDYCILQNIFDQEFL